MEKKTGISAIMNWLGTTEMFARPSKQLPGKWQLFEYYVDTDEKLLNFNEELLKNGSSAKAVLEKVLQSEPQNLTIKTRLAMTIITAARYQWIGILPQGCYLQ